MSEATPKTIRLTDETFDKFRKYCKDNGFTSQDQGFDHIMQIVELDRAKAAIPTRLTEIEEFEKSVKDIMAAYLRSLEINENAEGRIREQFSSDLVRKDKTIDDLQTKVDQLKAAKEAAETTAAEAEKAKDQAEKSAAVAERTAEDKKTIADTLAAKLAEAEKKADGYDTLKDALSASQDALRAAEQKIKDIQRDAADAAKDAARDAERTRDEAVRKVSDALQEKITALKDELRTVKSEADAAKRDAETAKAAAIAELSESHRQELAEIREKLDNRTDELIQAQQEIGELKMRVRQEQSK